MTFWKQISAAIILGATTAAFIPRVSVAQGTDAAALAQANNPLAAFKTFNLQNQYNGSLTGTDETANSFFLRGALPVSAFGGDWLVRATLPINNFPDPFKDFIFVADPLDFRPIGAGGHDDTTGALNRFGNESGEAVFALRKNRLFQFGSTRQAEVFGRRITAFGPPVGLVDVKNVGDRQSALFMHRGHAAQRS